MFVCNNMYIHYPSDTLCQWHHWEVISLQCYYCHNVYVHTYMQWLSTTCNVMCEPTNSRVSAAPALLLGLYSMQRLVGEVWIPTSQAPTATKRDSSSCHYSNRYVCTAVSESEGFSAVSGMSSSLIGPSQQGWNSANALTQLTITPSSHQWVNKVSHSDCYDTHVPLCAGDMHTYIRMHIFTTWRFRPLSSVCVSMVMTS